MAYFFIKSMHSMHTYTRVLKSQVPSVAEHHNLRFSPLPSHCADWLRARYRHIQWNIHLLNLIEAYLDVTDEDGMAILLDWEKAYDRVSWDYLHAAAKAIGLGTYFCEWLHVLYDSDRPVKRRVNVNGHIGEYFDLGCSTAQGCPASPRPSSS